MWWFLHVSLYESHHCVLNGLGRAVSEWFSTSFTPGMSSSTYAHRDVLSICGDVHSAVCRAQREWESQEREGWTLFSFLFSSLDGSTHSVVANFLSADPKGKKYTFDPFRWTFNMLHYERGSLNATIASKRLSDKSEERIFKLIKECFEAFVRSRLRSDIHYQYWKFIVYKTCTIDFQYWQ